MKIIVTTEANTFTPSKESIVKEYIIENDGTPKTVNDDYEEARRVWSEYYVIADCGTHMLSNSHTFSDQWRNEEMHNEFMIGAYEE